MEQKSLKTAFESVRPELEAKLSSMTLSKDSVKIQQTIIEYLNRLLDENGEYRQNLTMSEDYVLQAAISLLNAQQAMVLKVASNIQSTDGEKQSEQQVSVSGYQNGKEVKREQYPVALGGTALGGAVGAITLGTWGAVFGAIAGTAIALYYTSSSSQQASKAMPVQVVTPTQGDNNKINALLFLDIVEAICVNVDKLIDTFRVQTERIKNSFTSKNEQSFLADYNVIAKNMEQLFIIADSDDEDKLNDFTMQIDLLRRSLSNYGMEFNNGKILRK